MRHSRINNKSGYSLIWVIIVSVVGIILGAAVLSLAMGEVRHAARSEKQMQVNYIARSGVEAGFQGIQTLQAKPSIAEFVGQAKSNLSVSNQLLGNGNYTLDFEQDDVFIKIKSTGVHTSDPNITSNVDLYVETTFGRVGNLDWVEPPKSWMRASNLWGSISPDVLTTDDLTGKPVVFTGTPTKSPQNDINPSTFRATLLYFRGYDKNSKVSFLQQPNTNEITLDAEVIIMEGRILLRDTKPLILSSSEKVLQYHDPNFEPWTYGEPLGIGPAGFENEGRYKAFVEYMGPTPGFNYAETYKFSNNASNTKFGLISITGQNNLPAFNDSGVFKDTVDSSNRKIADGIYFYRSGVNLNDVNLQIATEYGSNVDLIRVHNDDPIITALTQNQGTRVFKASTQKYMYQSN